jgi:hypothetical protein
MKARLRRVGIGGSIATLLAAGALLLPAAPAQAQVSRGSCQMLASEIDLAYANYQFGHGFELELEGVIWGCW